MATTISPLQRFLAYCMGGIGLGTNAAVYFLVPIRAYELGVNVAVIGLLLGTKGLTEALSSVPVGAVIARIGPRAACLIGSLGVALCGVAFAFANSLAWLFVIQIAIGALRPLAWIGGQSYAAGMRGADHRGTDASRFSFAANVGQMIVPLIAGFTVQHSGTHAAFLVMAGYSAVFVVIAALMPDVARTPSSGRKDRSGFGTARSLLRRKSMQVDLLLTFTRLWVPSAWSSFLPVYLVSVGTSTVLAGAVSSSMAVVATAVSLFAGKLVRWGSPTMMTALVLATSAIGMMITPFLTAVPWVFLSSILVGIGQGLSLPLLLVLVSTSAPPEMRSHALGLRASINQVSAAASPVLTAQVIALTSLTVGFVLSGGLALLFVLAAVVMHRQRRPDEVATPPAAKG